MFIQAWDIVQAVKSKRIGFVDATKKYSQNVNTQSSEQYFWKTLFNLPSLVVDKVKKMKKGEISPPFILNNGIQIMQLIKIKGSNLEKNYISKKVVYGWDKNNQEAYNRLDLVDKFLIKNGMKKEIFKIYDYDLDFLPTNSFDYIISLYSLDYHYDFNLYFEYFKKILNSNTKIIFDTIRPDYFKKIFTSVEIINIDENTVHKSKRIICSGFKN